MDNVIEIFTSTRVQILSKLRERPFTVSEIAKLTGYSKTTVTYHLSKLSEAGLVERVERGKWVYYRITSKGEKRLRVEIAVAVSSIVAAVISIVGFAAVKLQKTTPVMITKSVGEIRPMEDVEYAITRGMETLGYEYLMIVAAIVFTLVFLYIKFRR